jgi:hypothetical protein
VSGLIREGRVGRARFLVNGYTQHDNFGVQKNLDAVWARRALEEIQAWFVGCCGLRRSGKTFTAICVARARLARIFKNRRGLFSGPRSAVQGAYLGTSSPTRKPPMPGSGPEKHEVAGCIESRQDHRRDRDGPISYRCAGHGLEGGPCACETPSPSVCALLRSE